MTTKAYCIYIMANTRYGTLYIGITSDLIRRVYEHRTYADPKSFTAKHNVTRLVHFEVFDDPENAIRREKRLKKWSRDWKINLLERDNPNWDDLYDSLL